MPIESMKSVERNMEGDFNTLKTSASADVAVKPKVATAVEKPQQKAVLEKDQNDRQEEKKNWEPSQNTLTSVFSEANQKMRMAKTRCEYSYHEPTKRVSIKVFDKDTDQLIREVPPEKSLEMLQKIWEIAGIIVDEKI